MAVTDLTGTTWRLNEIITDTVPDGSNYQRLNIAILVRAVNISAINFSAFDQAGIEHPSSWSDAVSRFPQALLALGATDVVSTLQTSVNDDVFDVRLFGPVECCGNEDDGYFTFSATGGTHLVHDPELTVTGTISCSLAGQNWFIDVSEYDGDIQRACIDNDFVPFYDTDIDVYDYDPSSQTGVFAFNSRTITIIDGSDATDPDLIAWLEANATQVVESPLTITYNGDTIHTTSSAESFTLPTNGKVMESDLVFALDGSLGLQVSYGNTQIINASSAGTFTLPCNGKVMSGNITGTVTA